MPFLSRKRRSTSGTRNIACPPKTARPSTRPWTTPTSVSPVRWPTSSTEPRARAVERAIPLGAAPRRHSRRPGHLERRRARAQAGHFHDQLHGVGNHRRLDGRHPQQGARGGPHAEGRLRHRLRILDAASARRLRLGRRRLHLRARCRSWISTTRCVSPCRRPVAAAARRWAPSTSGIRTRWSSSAPSARTAACASSTCRC